MYDIVFHYQENYPQYKLDWLKKTYPNAHLIQVGENFNYVIYSKKLASKINTKMFWFLPAHIGISRDILKFQIPQWDSEYVHHQLIDYDNLFLIPKAHNYTDDQFEKNFFNNVKFVEFGIFYKKIYDVFFLSYGEPYAEKNYQNLLKKHPYAKRIRGVSGIHKAHKHAALESSTDFLWVVDADAELTDDFNFDYEVPNWDFDVVHIWQSQNRINDLVYGNGGVKLLPRHLTLELSRMSIDITTRISKNIKVMDTISNYNNFATSPLNAWRSAFRECVKLSSKVIDRQVEEETAQRLNTWCTVARGEFAEYVLAGANYGKEYGIANKGNAVNLAKVNNFLWLESEFNRLQAQ